MFRPKLSPIWKQRNFRLLWFGETISLLGSTVSHFALPVVAVVTLHVSAGQMGLMRALGSAPSIVLGLLAGVWVDRLDRRRLLVATNLLAAALMASVPIAHLLGTLTVFHLYALWFAFGFLGAFWWPAWNSFLPTIVAPDDLVEANSKVEFAWSSMGVAGPALGALLISWFTAPGVLAFDAVTFVVCAAFIVRIRPPAVTTEDGPRVGTFRQIGDGLRATFADVMQRAITIPRVILDFVDGLSLTVFAIYVIREVGLSPQLLGVSLALSWVGFALGAAIAPRLERRIGIGTMIVLGLLLVGISPYTMVIANSRFSDWVNVVFLAIPGWVGGFGGIVQFIGLTALRQSLTPRRLLGRVYASSNVVGEVATLLGALTGGLLGDTIGLRPAIATAAILYGIPFLYALASPLRRASRVAEEAEEDAETEAEPEPERS